MGNDDDNNNNNNNNNLSWILAPTRALIWYFDFESLDPIR
jgi:hypothetical protein